MTIAKGQPWGRLGPLEEGGPVADTDTDLAAAVEHHVVSRASGESPPVIGLSNGDLHSTLGGAAARLPTDPDAWRFPVDAIVVRRGGADQPVVAMAHVVAFRQSDDPGFRARLAMLVSGAGRRAELRRMPWFVDETLVVANAAFVGDWNVAPRSHPNDGRLHVTRGRLPRRDRRGLETRLRTGTHLPHPDLATSRPKALDSGAGPWRLFVDGVDHGLTDRFSVQVVPDAVTVVM